MSKKTFYRDCYLKNGWLPAQPLARGLAVGDVCQLRLGCLRPLLNLADAHLAEKMALSRPLPLDPADWAFSRGVQQTLCETQWAADDDGERAASTRQVLEFSMADSFVFHAAAVQARLLTNWDQIRDDVTLKLTQLHYSFRDVYLVTAAAAASDWALAAAGQAGARLETSAAIGGGDHHALLSHASARDRQCHGLSDLERSRGRHAHFFKARKLVSSDAMRDRYLGQLLEQPGLEVANWLDASLLNLVKANELNLATSIGFFAWADMTLDDVELLTG
jgi:hypothetical protein